MSIVNPIVSTFSASDRKKLVDYELSKRKGAVVLEYFEGFALIGITRIDDYVVLGFIQPNATIRVELVTCFYSVDDYIKHDEEQTDFA